MGVTGVRNYVARTLVGLEKLVPADNAEQVKIAQAKFSGARLMAELITSSTLEKRLKQLEKAELAAAAAQVMEKNPLPGVIAVPGLSDAVQQ